MTPNRVLLSLTPHIPMIGAWLKPSDGSPPVRVVNNAVRHATTLVVQSASGETTLPRHALLWPPVDGPSASAPSAQAEPTTMLSSMASRPTLPQFDKADRAEALLRARELANAIGAVQREAIAAGRPLSVSMALRLAQRQLATK